MGRTHATSGCVLALALLPALHSAGMDYTPVTIGTYAIAAAAGAMIPDFDHPSATIAHSLWPVSKWAAQAIERLSGGHRNGTHSLLGWLAITVFAVLIGQVGPVLAMLGVPPARAALAGQIVLGCWLAFLFAIATTALRIKPPGSQFGWSLLCLAGGIGLAFANLLTDAPTDVLAIGVSVGVLAHLLGDSLTKEGVPWLYGFSKARFHVMSITTDHFTERVIIGPLLGVVAVAQCAELGGLFTWAQAWQWCSRLVTGA